MGFHVDVKGYTDRAIDALAGDAGFGVFYASTKFNSNSLTELFLGFDDNGAGPDDNHDDMIVRVVFTPRQDLTSPVPEAASLATWGGLTAAAGVVALRSSRRRRVD